jgi:flagellar biosynthesis/type III secretory pathway protein FliH
MYFRSNMTTHEFVDWLRYSAIDGGMPQQFIDQVDSILLIPTEEEQAEEIEKISEEEYDRGFKNGLEEGENNKENAAQDAAKAIYKDCCDAVERKGKEIGLTDEQIHKVINHILWDCRP